MSDFFKKLNVLVKASLHDLIDTNANRPILKSRRLGQNLDREVVTLRDRINEALAYEDELVERVEAIKAGITRLDQQADMAIEAGRAADARQMIADLQRAQQRLTMAEADLNDHRLVTQKLITKVNELEAAVADAKYAQPETADEEPLAAGQVLADVLHEMQNKIVSLRDTLEPSPVVDEESAVAGEDDREIDDDLARRLERLSKK